MAYLAVETREDIQHVAVDRPRLTIGRLPSNDVVLPYQQISRYHAELRQVGEVWWIADLQSTNGLRVRGERVERRALRPGERVFLAPGVTVRLVVPDDSTDLAVMPTTHMASIPASASSQAARARLAGTTAPPAPLSPPGAHPPAAASGANPAVASGPPTLPGDASPQAWLPSARASAWIARPHSLPPDAPESADTWRFAEPPDAEMLEGDLFRRHRSRAGDDALNTPPPVPEGGTPNPSAALLHLCQTCGQLTAPDAIHCQSCQSSLARPCRACALPLLPIHDRCPRCQAPNAASVLRARRGAPGA